MADAKIITYGKHISAGSTAIPDNVEVALDIETTAGEDWILIDTENGAEAMTLAGGNFAVKIGTAGRGPQMRQGHAGASQPGYPVYTFRGDTNTGMTDTGTADQLSLVAGGAEIIRATSKRGATVSGSAVVKGKASFVLTGSIDVTGTNVNVPGTGTAYLSELAIGDDILVSGETRTIATITNDTTATVTAAWGSDLANDTSPECNPAAFTVVRDTGTIGMVVDDNGRTGFGGAPTLRSTPSQMFVTAGNAAICHFRRADPSIHVGHIELRSNVEDGVIRAGKKFIVETNNGTEALEIDASQNVGIAMTPGGSHKLDVTGTAGLSTGTAWTNTSDSRIKKDVQDIENALDKINDLRPVSFQYTDEYLSVHAEIDGSKRYNSFIAQEYAQVFPDAVTDSGGLQRVVTPKTDDAPAVKETLLENVLQFTPHDLNMYLVKAVQELTARVAELEAGD